VKIVVAATVTGVLMMSMLLPGAEPAAAASGLRIASQGCGADTVDVHFQWESSGEGPQWIDISLFDNRFQAGTFIGVGPLPADQTAFIWTDLLQGRRHYVRINTFVRGGWQESGTLPFTTSDCRGPAPAILQGASQDCHGDRIVAKFFWQTATPFGEVQWLDLSLHNNGFAPGTFISAGPLEGGPATSFTWRGLLDGTVHYWRVNTWTGTRWMPSATGMFHTDVAYINPDGSCGHAHGDPGP
jgi:hypothetical protein